LNYGPWPVIVCLRDRDVLNYRMDLFNLDIFGKPMIRYWRQSRLFLITPSQK
jgi:hypothetical protein